MRALNVVTADVLNQIQQIQIETEFAGQSDRIPTIATVQLLPPTVGPDSWWWVSPGDIRQFESTFPSPEPMDNFGSAIARDLVEFEALRRGTIIVLALTGLSIGAWRAARFARTAAADDWNKTS